MLHSAKVLITATLLLLPVSLRAQHPRLFVTAERLTQMKSAVQTAGSHHSLALAAMKARVDKSSRTSLGAYGTADAANYNRSYLAREAALLSLLCSGTEAQGYANKAYDALRAMYEEPDHDSRFPESGYGLARAMTCMGFALAYDFCYGLWTQAQRDWARGKMVAALDAWPSYAHDNFGDARASNWVAVCRGAELVTMLAADEETKRASRYSFLKTELTTHMKNGYGSLGVSQEGFGYLEYGGPFLAAAVLAAESVNDAALKQEFVKHEFWRLEMYAAPFIGRDHRHIMQGVAGKGYFYEGFPSQLLHFCPPGDLPYYMHWYDRALGKSSPVPEALRYDGERAGTVYALIYYPETVTSKDPGGTYPLSVADSNGFYFFRNRWQDGNDILTAVFADTRHDGHAWDQGEALNIGLSAFGTRFIGGPGKTTTAPVKSTLLVDGKAASQDATGKKEFFASSPAGGYAIVDGGSQYTGLGLTSAKRHLLVNHSSAANGAILSTLDQARDNTSHTYTWNLNLGDDAASDGVTAAAGSEAGLTTFTLTGRNNGYVKGWVMNPVPSSKTSGDPLKLDFTGANVDIWIVMSVGSGTPPAATVTGSGLNASITINGATVAYNSAENRINAGLKDSTPPATPATGKATRKPGDTQVINHFRGAITIEALDLGAEAALIDASGRILDRCIGSTSPAVLRVRGSGCRFVRITDGKTVRTVRVVAAE